MLFIDIITKSKKLKQGFYKVFLILPIVFLIYIHRVFEKISKTCPPIVFLSFMNNLEFVSRGLIKKKVKNPRKFA